MSVELQPKVRVLKAVYFRANLKKRLVGLRELLNDIQLWDYSERPCLLLQLLLNYCRQGLIHKEKIGNVSHFQLTEKGIKRMNYFEQKLEEDSDFLKRSERNRLKAEQWLIQRIKRGKRRY